MKITFWGTRGSLPSPGPETVRYGGNTPCVEVRGQDGTRLILDAGTGIRRLGAAIPPDVARIDLLLTHLHMDHIQGLGFFAPLYRPRLPVHIWGPASATRDLGSRLRLYLSPPLFPVRLRDLPCRLDLRNVPLGRFRIGGLELAAALVCHPGPTVGYRITEGGTTVAYLPDHEPALGARRFPLAWDWTSGFSLVEGADVLIHDAQFAAEEYAAHIGWGHSAIPHAVALARMASVRRLVLFHHDPGHPDVVIDRLANEVRAAAPSSLDVLPAEEGITIQA